MELVPVWYAGGSLTSYATALYFFFNSFLVLYLVVLAGCEPQSDIVSHQMHWPAEENLGYPTRSELSLLCHFHLLLLCLGANTCVLTSKRRRIQPYSLG